MSMLTDKRAGPIDRTVLLFSGGMDSVCIKHLLKPDVLLIVPQPGCAYSHGEEQGLLGLRASGFFHGVQATSLVRVLDLSRWERDDLIVPNRNAHLVLLATNFGDTIWLGSVYGDRSNDKDEEFYRLMNDLLAHMHDEQHWTRRRNIVVSAPVKHLTKSELVAEFLDADGDPDVLLMSWSCYSGGDVHCGSCKPCLRKRVALANNDVSTPDGYWASDFWDAEWWPVIREQIARGLYRGREDQEVLSALGKMGVA